MRQKSKKVLPRIVYGLSRLLCEPFFLGMKVKEKVLCGNCLGKYEKKGCW